MIHFVKKINVIRMNCAVEHITHKMFIDNFIDVRVSTIDVKSSHLLHGYSSVTLKVSLMARFNFTVKLCRYIIKYKETNNHE